MAKYEKVWIEHMNKKLFEKKKETAIFYQAVINDSIFNVDLIDFFPTEYDGSCSICDLWYLISKRKEITIDVIKRYPNKPWNGDCLSCNDSISLEDIMSNPAIDWSPFYVSKRHNLTFEIVQKHPEFPWCYYVLARKMPFEVIFNNLHLPWFTVPGDFYSRNDLTLDILRKYPTYDWNWKRLINSWKFESLWFCPMFIDLIKASDINSGWNILKILKALLVTPEKIKQKFPLEFDMYCKNNSITEIDLDELSLKINTKIQNDTIRNQGKYHVLKTVDLLNDILLEKENFIECVARSDHKSKLKKVHQQIEEIFLRADNFGYSKSLNLFDGTIFENNH